MKKVSILVTLCFLTSEVTSAVTVSPLARLSALGGQYFTGATHSNGANVDASFVPAISLTPRLALIPIYLGSYNETQSVYTFLGENTLVQKQFDQTFVLRGVWAASASWRLKPRAGYKKEWAQQSTDQNLWNGLFNYDRVFGGLSAERLVTNGSWELGYEYSRTRYPNYQSLSSDPRLTATGITASAGQDVLNFRSHETSLTYQHQTTDKRLSYSGTFDWVRENFVDQKVITQGSGGFEDFVDTPRTDDIFNLALQQGWQPNARWGFGLGETLQYYVSNQNAFDAQINLFNAPFTYRYYNYVDVQLHPSVTRAWQDGRWQTTLSGSWGYRRYSHRRTQDGDGIFQNGLVHSMNRGGTLTVRYRIVKGLYGLLTGSILTYSSNTRYEANYPYNYTVSTYLGGLSWEY